MNTDKSALERGFEALKQLIDNGEKVNKHAVAKKGGFTHRNLYKAEFAGLREAIEAAEDTYKKRKLADDIEALKKQVIELKDRLKASELKFANAVKNDSIEVSYVMSKLQECYTLNARLMAENTDLRHQIAHSAGSYMNDQGVDKRTGEIISGSFNKN